MTTKKNILHRHLFLAYVSTPFFLHNFHTRRFLMAHRRWALRLMPGTSGKHGQGVPAESKVGRGGFPNSTENPLTWQLATAGCFCSRKTAGFLVFGDVFFGKIIATSHVCQLKRVV